jgi:hypothetical protein
MMNGSQQQERTNRRQKQVKRVGKSVVSAGECERSVAPEDVSDSCIEVRLREHNSTLGSDHPRYVTSSVSSHIYVATLPPKMG